jgi:hypothetical protein
LKPRFEVRTLMKPLTEWQSTRRPSSTPAA